MSTINTNVIVPDVYSALVREKITGKCKVAQFLVNLGELHGKVGETLTMPTASDLKTLQEMGAISKETIMEKTEYVSDVEVEKKRLSGENVSQDVSQKVDNPSKKVEIK